MHTIRKALGDDVLVSEGDALRLDVVKLRVDTLEFEAAFEGSEFERAAACRTGPFLDGFSLPGAVEFDQWMDAERERLDRLYHASLEKLAERAEGTGDMAGAAECWRRRLACTPTAGRVVVRLMQALADSGDNAGALRASATHAKLIATEFEAPPDPAVAALEHGLRSRTERNLGPALHQTDGSTASGTADPPSGVDPAFAHGADPTHEAFDATEKSTERTHAAEARLPRRLVFLLLVAAFVATTVALVRLMVTGVSATRSLVVLPFDAMSVGADQEYFVEGMYGAVHTELSRIGALRTVSRTTAAHYKASGKSAGQLARELGVDAIVEASVFRSGDRVRIDVQLVGVQPERQLWAESYDRHLRDVLALHADIARRIAAEVRARLLPAEAERLAETRVVDPQAYDDWLRASYHASRFTADGRRECIRYGNRAAARDSTFALAYALLADCYSNMTFLSGAPATPMFDSAMAAARTALELDSTSAQAHAAIAFGLAHHEWDWTGAEHAYHRALELSPSYEFARLGLAWLLAWTERFDEALDHARLAERLNPVSPHGAVQIGMILHLADRNDEALQSVERAVQIDPDFVFAHGRLYWISRALGQPERAVAAAERASRLAGKEDPRRRAFVAHAYGLAGRREQARAILDDLLEERPFSYVPPIAIAAAYVGLGEHDQALDWLEQGYEERDGDMVLLKTFSLWDPLREDPRFKALLDRMNFPG